MVSFLKTTSGDRLFSLRVAPMGENKRCRRYVRSRREWEHIELESPNTAVVISMISVSSHLSGNRVRNAYGGPLRSYQLPLTYSLTIQGNAHMDLILLRS